MSIDLESLDDGGVRVRTDRSGERAVSDVLSKDEAVEHLRALATLLGYTITPAQEEEA